MTFGSAACDSACFDTALWIGGVLKFRLRDSLAAVLTRGPPPPPHALLPCRTPSAGALRSCCSSSLAGGTSTASCCSSRRRTSPVSVDGGRVEGWHGAQQRSPPASTALRPPPRAALLPASCPLLQRWRTRGRPRSRRSRRSFRPASSTSCAWPSRRGASPPRCRVATETRAAAVAYGTALPSSPQRRSRAGASQRLQHFD